MEIFIFSVASPLPSGCCETSGVEHLSVCNFSNEISLYFVHFEMDTSSRLEGESIPHFKIGYGVGGINFKQRVLFYGRGWFETVEFTLSCH